MKNYSKIFLISVLFFSSLSPAYAELLCTKVVNKNGKFSLQSKRVVTAKCPSGYSLLVDTSVFVGPAGSTGAAGAQGAQGVQGVQGPTGDSGLAGATGARGVSAFDAIPSGSTVYGVIGNDIEAPSAIGGDFNAFASFPVKISQVLTSADVLIAPTANLLTACGGNECRNSSEVTLGAVCTGSAVTPTAPAGKVCIYISSLSSSSITAGLVVADPLPLTGTPTISTGFRVSWNANATGDTFLTGIWAYTAP